MDRRAPDGEVWVIGILLDIDRLAFLTARPAWSRSSPAGASANRGRKPWAYDSCRYGLRRHLLAHFLAWFPSSLWLCHRSSLLPWAVDLHPWPCAVSPIILMARHSEDDDGFPVRRAEDPGAPWEGGGMGVGRLAHGRRGGNVLLQIAVDCRRLPWTAVDCRGLRYFSGILSHHRANFPRPLEPTRPRPLNTRSSVRTVRSLGGSSKAW
jgi:hypothetical protein